MPYPNYATMSEIETECLNALGYSAMASARRRMEPIVRTHIKMAQDELIEEYRDELTRVINDEDPGKTVPGQSLYDVPDRCDPQHIRFFRVLYSGVWRNLAEGIKTYHRSWLRPPGWPVRYDVRRGTDPDDCEIERAQFELWPEPDGEYELELEYWETPCVFQEDNDKSSVDKWLLVQKAVAMLKAHYRQPDAEAWARSFQIRLARIKGKQHGNTRYKRKFRNDGLGRYSHSQYDETTNTGRVVLYDDW